ncbi:Odontogenic ameloblast-associated protein, partial [Lemmus lemmus]
QGAYNPWTSPFPGILQQQQQQQQQQAQIPGGPQFPLSTLENFAGLFPNQIPFSGQFGLAQVGQAGQPELSQQQTPPQTPQGANLSYMVPFKGPQDQTQMLGYYPVYMVVPWEQLQQVVTSSPQQTRPQLFEEQVLCGFIFNLISSILEKDAQGGQQHLVSDTFLGTAPETPGMPTEGGPLYSQIEPVSFKHGNAGVFMPSTSPKPSSKNVLTPAIDPTIAPVLPEQKVKTDNLREP